MADFKAFCTNKQIIQFKGVDRKVDSDICNTSTDTNSIAVIVEKDGSIVLVDDRKFRIEMLQ